MMTEAEYMERMDRAGDGSAFWPVAGWNHHYVERLHAEGLHLVHPVPKWPFSPSWLCIVILPLPEDPEWAFPYPSLVVPLDEAEEAEAIGAAVDVIARQRIELASSPPTARR